MNDQLYSVFGAAVGIVAFWLLVKVGAQLYFREKEKHLDRVMKKLEKEI